MSFFKGRAILWLLIPAVFAVAFLWDSGTNSKPQFIQEDSNPDYFLTQTQSIQFTPQGQVSKTFSSDKTLHFKSKMQTHLTNPVFSTHNQGQTQSWRVSAQSAINNELSEELALEGNVLLELSQANSEQSLTMSMPELTIDLASQNAFTQAPVSLEHPLYKMNATGMKADFIQQKVDFLADIQFEEK